MDSKKSRILYVKRYLETQTDETHPATVTDILAYLDGIGAKADRRTVASDVGQLIESGEDVVCDTGKRYEYFVGDRHFELPELKLLIDAVQASRFISPKKTDALIQKLTAFASVHQARELERHLYTDKQAKADNEKIYITIDLLHTAINAGKQVDFKYYEYDRNKKKVYKHKRKTYHFSPYGLIWSDDRYYVIGFSESHGKVIKFRVDRIAVPELTENPAVPEPEGFDMSVYARSVFQMYDGPVREVTLVCENDLMKAVIDRFGEEVKTRVLDDERFKATVSVSASPTFFGWVFSFSGRMIIAAPEDVAENYRALARCVP
jgi:predicted DNA-binding transcriptional regulator YafY